MRITTNVASMNSNESLASSTKILTNSLEKLATGLRLNKASDNASGIAIADKLRTQRSSIGQSIDNANSAIAMMQIADKAMSEQSNILDIVKTKLIQAGTATTSSDGRVSIAKDVNKLLQQLDNIASQTNYNGLTLLQASKIDTNATSSFVFQIGENNASTISTTGTIRANTDGLDNLAAIKTVVSGGAITATEARNAMDIVDKSIASLNDMRSNFGSTINQLESSTRNLLTTKTNIASAESVIRDVDYAVESSNFSKYTLIHRAGSYASSQANSMQNSVMMVLNAM